MANTTSRYISRIGIELEGGWDKPQRPSKNTEIHSDCSVNVPRANWVGEVVSKPIASRSGLVNWLKERYPDKVNQTCGLHVHVSLKNPNHYAAMASKKFVDDFTDWAEKFVIDNPTFDLALFKSRLAGDNTYAKRMKGLSEETLNNLLGQQITDRSKGNQRYYQLNFCHSLHTTMENRLFPCFAKVDEAIACVLSFLLFIEKWLAKNAKKILKNFDFEAFEEDVTVVDATTPFKSRISLEV